MCGIAGVLGLPADIARPAAERMLAALRHRGPDDLGIEVVPGPAGHPPAVIAHARLSIIDLSPGGHQPMRDTTTPPGARPNWLVFNGEVFNYASLRDELASHGTRWQTHSDTEVILGAYRAWGESSVERMRGMFAWCLLDTERGTIWFCRDRLGIKPLYMFRPARGGLLFASEVRALLAAGPDLVPPRLSATALESYLAQGMVCGTDTVVEGIELLASATSLVTDWSGKLERRRTYWRAPFPRGATDATPEERRQAVRRLGETLREAVQLRLVADVPLGLFLSAGVDSSALATVATEGSAARVQTLSIGFDAAGFDESPEAAQIAEALGTEHTTLRLRGDDVLAEIDEVFAAMDQPTVDGFNTYFVSRAARRAGLTVALSGLGGDELFGGYASFRDVPAAMRLRKRAAGFWPVAPLLTTAARLGRHRGLAKAAELLDRPPSLLQLYLLRRELFLPRERRTLQPLPAASDRASGLPLQVLHDLDAHLEGLDAENAVSAVELASYMRHMLLRDADVFSMAVGLEARVPLLDHHLVEAAAAMPGAWKRPDPRPKPLLLDAVGPRLHSLVYTRPKRGFTFPWDAWLRGPMRESAMSALARGDLWSQAGLDPTAPRRLWERFERRDPRVAALQILGLWSLARYIERNHLSMAH